MKDAPVREYEQGAFQLKDIEASPEPLSEGYRRTPCCNKKYLLAFFQERLKKGKPVEKASLTMLNPLLEDMFIV
jgi:hypothetical protein